jgi:hypothetical protein
MKDLRRVRISYSDAPEKDLGPVYSILKELRRDWGRLFYYEEP